MTGCRGTGSKTTSGICFLQFDGIDDFINCGTPAQLLDLHAADCTWDGWFLANSCGVGNVGKIVQKYTAVPTGWKIGFDAVNSLEALAVFAGGSAWSRFAFVPDGEWHHLEVVLSFVLKKLDIFLDGVEVAYSVQHIGGIASAATVDHAEDIIYGNDSAATSGWDGYLGWQRISAIKKHTSDFTAPERCVFPALDADTLRLGIYEGVPNIGAGGISYTYNVVGDYGHGQYGTGTNFPFWGCDCALETNDPTCAEEEVFISNHHVLSNITHAYWYDLSVGSWTSNLINGALPHLLLPPVPAVGDLVVFGIDSTLLYAAPFSSLVFDLLTAQADLTGVIWEYWDGAAPWGALTVQDNTNADGLMTGVAFDTEGVKSVHWGQPAAWVTGNLFTIYGGGAPNVTGWWVQARVTAIGGAPTPPWQQNRNIYAVNWPYIEIDEDDIGGDIEALAETNIKSQSDNDMTTGVNFPFMPWNRVIVSSRSLSRGGHFTPFINLSDNTDILLPITVSGTAAFAANLQCPTGRCVTDTNPIAVWADIISIDFDPSIVEQWHGTYRMFLVGDPAIAATTDIQNRIKLVTYETYERIYGPRYWLNITDPAVLDFGIITIPPIGSPDNNDIYNDFRIIIQSYGNGVADQDLWELVLMPTDEWSGDFRALEQTDKTAVGRRGTSEQRHLNIDSITFPKSKIRARVRLDSDNIVAEYQSITNGEFAVQSNSDQRLWFFTLLDAVADDYLMGYGELSNTVIMNKLQRYFSFRGDR